MIVRRIAVEYRRAIEAGKTPEQAEHSAYLTVSQEYAGERVYIAGLKKAQRQRRLSELGSSGVAGSTRELAAALGMSLRTVQRTRSGR